MSATRRVLAYLAVHRERDAALRRRPAPALDGRDRRGGVERLAGFPGLALVAGGVLQVAAGQVDAGRVAEHQIERAPAASRSRRRRPAPPPAPSRGAGWRSAADRARPRPAVRWRRPAWRRRTADRDRRRRPSRAGARRSCARRRGCGARETARPPRRSARQPAAADRRRRLAWRRLSAGGGGRPGGEPTVAIQERGAVNRTAKQPQTTAAGLWRAIHRTAGRRAFAGWRFVGIHDVKDRLAATRHPHQQDSQVNRRQPRRSVLGVDGALCSRTCSRRPRGEGRFATPAADIRAGSAH